MSISTISDILKLDFIPFLRALSQRYPEMLYLLGEATASPEGNQTLREDALAYRVFPDQLIASTAIEFDRTAMGLLCFKTVMNDDPSLFPFLSEASFQELRTFTTQFVKNPEDVEFIFYSLACNDLGKTHVIATQGKGDDHDQILFDLVSRPDLFPGMTEHLSLEQITLYTAGLGANLNLGQYVQGENLPWNLQGMQQVHEKARNLRLIAELYDFAGVAGHVSHTKSLVMTDDNLWVFMTAIQQLMTDPLDKAYERYVALRAQRVGLGDHPDAYALGRLAAMSRLFTPEQGNALLESWNGLPDKDRDALKNGLEATGVDGSKGVLVYYAPAVIANTLKTAGSPEAGLPTALAILAKVYKREAATPHDFTGDGVVTVDVNQMAKDCLADPRAVLKSLDTTVARGDFFNSLNTKKNPMESLSDWWTLMRSREGFSK